MPTHHAHYSYLKLTFLFLALVFSSQSMAKRVALVIGNHQYDALTSLANPDADAKAVAGKLKQLGFEVVGKNSRADGKAVFNLTQEEMYGLIDRFAQKANGAEVALVYYAGHGFQYNGEPYLIPSDAPKLSSKSSMRMLKGRSVSLDALLSEIDSVADLTVGVFDACREVPEIAKLTRSLSGGGSAYRGLGRVASKGKNRIIAYSGGAGQLVADGTGSLSPYTAILVDNLTTSTGDVTDVFQRVAYQFSQTHDGQNPELLIQGVEPNKYYLSANQNSLASAQHQSGHNQSNQNQSSLQMGNLTPAELASWQSISQCNDLTALQDFVSRFPNGTFTAAAKACISQIKPIVPPPNQPQLSAKELTEIVKKADDFYDTKDYTAAAKWYRKAAEQGNAFAQYNLGVMYDNGRGVSQDDAEAVNWYRKAASQGYAKAQYNLGVMYDNGQGVSQDDAEAVSWYRKAASQGYARAQTNLGNMYKDGHGVSKNSVEAVSWYRKAASQGYARAQYNLGFMYVLGQGVSQDDAEAVNWYRKAASQGYANAQYNLGVMYDNGRGVSQDDAEAVKWYRKAASQGYANAQYNLGVMYDNGQGVSQDDAEAVKWYRKAASQGYASAQYNLGLMYEYGDGVSKNRVEAVNWFRKAAKQGDTYAQNALKTLGY